MFGAPPTFKVEGNTTNQTRFGSVMTLVLAICMLGVGIMFFVGLFERSTPTLINYSSSNSYSGNLTLTPMQHVFGVALSTDPSSLIYNTSLFNITMAIGSSQAPQQELPTTFFSTENYMGIAYYIPDSIDILNQDVYIFFTNCGTHVTQSNADFFSEACEPFMEASQPMWFYNDTGVDPLDYDNPLFQRSLSTAFGGTVFMKTVNFSSDNGLLFKSENAQTISGIDSISPANYNFFNGGGYQLMFANNGNMDVYLRSYTKLQTVLAELNGVLAPLLFILGFAPRIWSKWGMYLNLAKATHTPSSGDLEPKGEDSASHLVPFDIQSNSAVPKEKSKGNFMNFVKIMFGEMISKPPKGLQSCQEQIDRNLDVVNIIRKNYQLEAMMSLLLTNDEKLLLEEMTQPFMTVPLQGEDAISFRKAWWDSDPSIRPPLEELAKKVTGKKEKTEIEKKLLQIYTNNFKKA